MKNSCFLRIIIITRILSYSLRIPQAKADTRMKLHCDKDAFRVLIESVYEQTGYRSDVLEKDYYVVLILKELAEKQAGGLPAYFKGDTALYKALKTINRFSDDFTKGGGPDSNHAAHAASYRQGAGCIDRHFRHYRLCGKSAKDGQLAPDLRVRM